MGQGKIKRIRSNNVIQVPNDSEKIIKAVKKQLKKGKYKSSNIYGSGNASKQIADILFEINPKIQKTIAY